MKKNQYAMVMIALVVGVRAHAVNPEEFIRGIAGRCALKEEALVSESCRLSALLEERIQKAFENKETALAIGMETSIAQRGFFNVSEILQDPATCREIVQLAFGLELYARIVGCKVADQRVGSVACDQNAPVKQGPHRKKGIRASLKRVCKRFLGKKSVLVEHELTEKLYVDEAQATADVHEKVEESNVLHREGNPSKARIQQLVEEEFLKAQERLTGRVAEMCFGRGCSDVRAAMKDAALCKKVVRLGCGPLAYDSFFGVEKNVQELERALYADCGIQTDDECLDGEPTTEDACIEAEFVRSQVDARLKMSMRRASKIGVLLEVKRNLNDQMVCAGIVRLGLGDEGYERLIKLTSKTAHNSVFEEYV